MPTQPTWWTKEVELAFLGPYSYEKLETIVAANEGLQHLKVCRLLKNVNSFEYQGVY